MADTIITCVAAWLLTYAIHSTVLLGGVWAISRAPVKRFERVEETAWRVAMFGSVVTSAIQTLLLIRRPALVIMGAAGSMSRGASMASASGGAADSSQGIVVPVVITLWAVVALVR